MNILLDTHLLLWWLKDDEQLSQKARSLIEEAQCVYVSSVSIWEAVIKIQLNKLDVRLADLASSLETEGFLELPFTAKHAAKIIDLPYYHRDPFDRALIAQAMTEPLCLLTSDRLLKTYSELVEIV